MSTSTEIIVRRERVELAETWRVRADRLENMAERERHEGDPYLAEQFEAAAGEYRTAADELELGAVQ